MRLSEIKTVKITEGTNGDDVLSDKLSLSKLISVINNDVVDKDTRLEKILADIEQQGMFDNKAVALIKLSQDDLDYLLKFGIKDNEA